jgi:tripartite-type tricarboxylate transporter receptor subunit TctC
LPKRIPAPIVKKLHDATVAAMERPSLQERLKEIGAVVVVPERRSSEYLQKYLASEILKWATAIKGANIKTE